MLPHPRSTPTRPFAEQQTATPIGWAYAALGLALAFVLYVSYVHPPDGGYFTTDEQFIADSGVFMLYGATPRCLDWPGIPMVIVFYLLALGQCALNLLHETATGHLSAVDVFRVIDKTAATYLLDRTPLLLAGRTVQIALVFGLLLACIRVIYRANVGLLPPVMRFSLVVLLCLPFDVMAAAPVIRPEALAYALFALVSLLILFGNFRAGSWRLPSLILLLMAVLVSHRLLFLFTFPFLLGGLWLRMGFRAKQVLGTLGLLLLGTLLAIPFLLTDTLVVLKSFVGGMLMKVGTNTSFFNWAYVQESVMGNPTVWQVGLVLVGCVAFWRHYPNRVMSALLLGNLLVLTLAVFHAATIYHTHTLPIRCLALFPMLYGVYWLFRLTKKRWLTYGLLLLFVGTNAAETLKLLRGVFAPTTMWQVATYLKTLPPNSRVLIDAKFDNLLPRSRNALQRELQHLQDPALTQLKYKRQLDPNLTTDVPIALSATLSEDERLAVLQRQVLLRETPEGKHTDLYLFSPNVGFVNYFVEQQTAFADFERGQYDYLITHKRLPNREPLRGFYSTDYWEPYYAYRSTKP